MPTEVILPKVDMDMETGLVSGWHVEAGSTVSQGDALFDIETDKAAMEVEAPASGTLAHIVAPEGTRVPVGAAVAWIYASDEDIPDAPPETAPAETTDADPREEPEPATAGAGAPAAQAEERPGTEGHDAAEVDGIRATPAARRAAREAGLRLAEIAGSGPKGRVHAEDVAAAVAELERPAPRRDAQPARTADAPQAIPAAWSDQPGALAVTRRKGHGTGAPIVFFHGFAADSTGWAPLEKALGKSREIVRVDLASHGRSPLKSVASFAEFAKLAVRAFDALDIDDAHVVGHSLGGAVAATVADIRPRGIRSLGLISPAGLGPEIDGTTLLGIARATRTESLAPWLKRLAANPDTISWDFAQAAMMARIDEDMRAAQLSLADTLFPDGTQSFDLRPALSRVEVPLSVIWGRQDSILPWRHVLHAPDRAALHLLDHAGHIPHIERAEACAEALLGLMTRAEARERVS